MSDDTNLDKEPIVESIAELTLRRNELQQERSGHVARIVAIDNAITEINAILAKLQEVPVLRVNTDGSFEHRPSSD